MRGVPFAAETMYGLVQLLRPTIPLLEEEHSSSFANLIPMQGNCMPAFREHVDLRQESRVPLGKGRVNVKPFHRDAKKQGGCCK